MDPSVFGAEPPQNFGSNDPTRIDSNGNSRKDAMHQDNSVGTAKLSDWIDAGASASGARSAKIGGLGLRDAPTNDPVEREIVRIVVRHVQGRHPHVQRHLRQDLRHLVTLAGHRQAFLFNHSSIWHRLWVALKGDL